MATTHAFIGLLAGVASLPVTAKYAPAPSIMLAAFIGGLLPDLDLVITHRKTLHFPVIFPVAAFGLLTLSTLTGSQLLFVFGIAVASAGLHSITDIFGGGVGYEPWKQSSSKGVYNHVLGRWHRPKRLVRYSGASEDFWLAAGVAIPLILSPTLGSSYQALLIGTLIASGLYTVSRRRLPRIASMFTSVFPVGILHWLPLVQLDD